MLVACSTRCFAQLPFDAAMRKIAELEFDRIELVLCGIGDHPKPEDVAADEGRVLVRVRQAAGVAIGAIEVPVSLDHARLDILIDGARALALQSGATVVTLAAPSLDWGLERTAARLEPWTRRCAEAGIALSLPTVHSSLTGRPDSVLELCRRLPHLGITLDPTCLVQGEAADAEAWLEVYGRVVHVQLRDSLRSPGPAQVPVGQGVIDYSLVIAHLERWDYQRLLSVHLWGEQIAQDVVDGEVRKLRLLLESLA